MGGPSFRAVLALPVALPGLLAVRVYPGAFLALSGLLWPSGGLPGGMPCGVWFHGSMVAPAACSAFCGLLRGFGPVVL